MKISVLMSIYYKENPKYFDLAMHSLWTNQSIKPNEIVLVKDGPIPFELNNMIQLWQNKLKDILKVLTLDNNQGNRTTNRS